MSARHAVGGWVLLMMGLLVSGCREAQPTQRGDDARLKSMHAEIEAMVGTPSCHDSSECAFIGLGSKPCGGPWTYLVYSKSSVDPAALQSKVEAYNRFEDAVNKRYGRMSDCMAILPPRVGCVDGKCVNLDVAR